MCIATTCYWLLSDEHIDLADGVRGLQEVGKVYDPFGPSRTRLREGRELRKP
jgi:hypothetical protein